MIWESLTTLQFLPLACWIVSVGPSNESKPQYARTIPLTNGEIGQATDFDLEVLSWGVAVMKLHIVEPLLGLLLFEDEAVFEVVGYEGNVRWLTGPVQVQHKIVRKTSGEHERRTFDSPRHLGLQKTGHWVGVVGTKRWQSGILDCREANDDDGLWIMKRRRSIEL